jgi:hypothetical protein
VSARQALHLAVASALAAGALYAWLWAAWIVGLLLDG